MPNFETGVKSYIKGKIIINVAFPVDFHDNYSVNCYQCRYFSRSSGICLITKEVSPYPEKYISDKCPIIFDEE